MWSVRRLPPARQPDPGPVPPAEDPAWHSVGEAPHPTTLAPRPALAPASAGLATSGSTRRCAVPKAACGSRVQGRQTDGDFSRWGCSAGPRQAAQPQHSQPSCGPWASGCPSGDEEPGVTSRPLGPGLPSLHLYTLGSHALCPHRWAHSPALALPAAPPGCWPRGLGGHQPGQRGVSGVSLGALQAGPPLGLAGTRSWGPCLSVWRPRRPSCRPSGRGSGQSPLPAGPPAAPRRLHFRRERGGCGLVRTCAPGVAGTCGGAPLLRQDGGSAQPAAAADP